MTKINLELLTDIDMHLFIEKGLRGGISYISTGHAKANNPYMKDYDSTQESKYIMYLDANNLYGWAMVQSLPTNGFKWVDCKDISSLDCKGLSKYLDNYTNESDRGLILEVDLEYPSELHDLHNDYPLAPERLCITEDMLSPHNKKIRDLFNIKCGNIEKLTTTLKPKRNYVLHFQNLKQYLSLGLKVTKIHRAIEFNQSKWMSQYILFNTEKRKKARNAFEKDFFKLMNNSVFGRTMMNVRKHRNIKLCTTEKQIKKLVSKPTFVTQKIITKGLVAVENKTERLTLNQPLYVGMSILDLSKTLMYDFHYNYIKEKYGSLAKLLFTDTDSLMYEITAVDPYKDFYKDKDLFDNSDYSTESPYYFGFNKKVIGKMKDECAGLPITELIGLRSKMYSYITETSVGTVSTKKAKGINKIVIKKNITHEEYKTVLLENLQKRHSMNTIRSINHRVGSYTINKTSLSCFNDKRYVLDHRNTLAYGHVKLARVEMKLADH
ncbi:uncharacterized protein LOC144432741 [Glandiceps talaboti]